MVLPSDPVGQCSFLMVAFVLRPCGTLCTVYLTSLPAAASGSAFGLMKWMKPLLTATTLRTKPSSGTTNQSKAKSGKSVFGSVVQMGVESLTTLECVCQLV